MASQSVKQNKLMISTSLFSPLAWIVVTLALGLRQGKGLQGCRPRGRPESHITCSRECKKCEGMNPHNPKWTPIVEVGVSNGLPNIQSAIQGSKPIVLNNFLYRWKTIETQMSKMGLHCSFGHLKHKLWPKEGSRVKLLVRECECHPHTPSKWGCDNLGVLGQKAIWMWPPWRGAEYTIRGKVMVSPKSGSWWVLFVHVARGLS
jgi:hypothetical protein